MPGVSDDVVTNVAIHYRALCIDLSRQFDDLWHDLHASGFDIETKQARDHVRLLASIDPVQIAKADQDIREGRFITLEQARRELRAKSH